MNNDITSLSCDLGNLEEYQQINIEFAEKLNQLIDKFGSSTPYHELNDEINQLSSDFCKYNKNLMYMGNNDLKIIDYTMKYITGKISILTNDNSKYFKWIEV